jgi:hypothetical protein
MDMNRDREVRTSDIETAAYLIAEGGRLSGLERTSDPRRMNFVIVGDQLNLLLDAFHDGAVTVNLDAFLAAQHLLKSRLYRSGRTR